MTDAALRGRGGTSDAIAVLGAALAGVAASALALALYARIAWPWVPLGFAVLVPWLWSLDRVRTAWGALLSGMLMSEALVLVVFGWFAGSIETYTGAPRPVGLALLLGLAPFLEPQLPAFALTRHVVRRRAGGEAAFWRTTLAGASAYVAAEWACGKLFADTLGHGLHASTLLRQAADLGGARVLTFALVVANECVLAALRAAATHGAQTARLRATLRPTASAAAIAIALAGYGALRLRALGADAIGAPVLTVAAVQADLDRYDRLAAEAGTYDATRAILDAHFELSADALEQGPVDLLVWAETVYPTTFGAPKSAAGAELDRAIAAFVAASRVPLVFGTYDAEGGAEFNAAVVLDPTAARRLEFEVYRKAHLFPLTERVPAWLDAEAVRRRLPWLGAWKPGAGGEVLAVTLPDSRHLRIAPLICYDALDPGLARAAVRRGAELLVTISNDAWFAEGAGPRLHVIGAAFRSIETRRPQVRATTTGISAVIDPTGELVATAGVHERAALVASVPLVAPALTLAVAWGDWLGPAALALCAALVLAAFLRPPVAR